MTTPREYKCVECGEPTAKGSLVMFQGGEVVILALCQLDMDKLRRDMVSRGVHVDRADRLN